MQRDRERGYLWLKTIQRRNSVREEEKVMLKEIVIIWAQYPVLGLW
jgi:hypothetical protein